MTAEEYMEENLHFSVYQYRYAEVIKIMKSFAQLKCKEQRELCADNLKDEHFEFVDKYKEVGLQARYLALNSPEPKF
jgi:hypothetical protein